MAERGSKKGLSVDHEDWLAMQYDGRRSPSSGAAAHDAADVRTAHDLIESKTDFSLAQTCECGVEKSRCGFHYRKSRLVRLMEETAAESYKEGLDPVVAFRFYDPRSSLADHNGYVDLTVRRSHEDSVRIPDDS